MQCNAMHNMDLINRRLFVCNKLRTLQTGRIPKRAKKNEFQSKELFFAWKKKIVLKPKQILWWWKRTVLLHTINICAHFSININAYYWKIIDITWDIKIAHISDVMPAGITLHICVVEIEHPMPYTLMFSPHWKVFDCFKLWCIAILISNTIAVAWTIL